MNTLQRWLGNACGEWPMRPPFIVQFCALLVLLAAPAAAQILPQGHRFYGETVGSALAREIAVGNGEVWIIGNESTGGGNYNVMHLVGNHFERVAGQAVKIAVDGQGVPWVITAQNTIWRFDPSRRRSWDRMPGQATEIAAGGNEVWTIGVDANDPDRDIARWNGSRWVGVPGRGAKISVTANGTAYVVNSRGNLYRRTTASTTGFDRLADGVNQVNATAYLPGSPASDEIVVVTTTTGKVLAMAGDAWYGSNGDSGVGLGQGPALALRVARDAARSLRVYAILGGTPYGQAGPVIIGEPNEDETYAAPVVAQANPAPATLGYFIPAQAIDGEAARSDIVGEASGSGRARVGSAAFVTDASRPSTRAMVFRPEACGRLPRIAKAPCGSAPPRVLQRSGRTDSPDTPCARGSRTVLCWPCTGTRTRGCGLGRSTA